MLQCRTNVACLSLVRGQTEACGVAPWHDETLVLVFSYHHEELLIQKSSKPQSAKTATKNGSGEQGENVRSADKYARVKSDYPED